MRRLCLTCGAVIDGGTRCLRCSRARSRARWHAHGAQRYDASYQAERRRWAVIVEFAGYRCARGGERWPPGAPFDLDHLDGRLAPSCPRHNRANRPAASR